MDGKDSTVWIRLLALAMRTEPSRDPQCSRTGTISRGVHDRSAGRLGSVPQPHRGTRRTVPQLASTRRQLDQKARKTSSESWWTTDASTRESSRAAISCRSWCSPAARPPPRQPQKEPYYPDSSRLVLHSCSGPMRAGPPPSLQDRCDWFSSVLAPSRNQDTVLRNAYARMIKVSRHSTFPSPQQPSPSSTEPERSELADHSHGMGKEEELDGRCLMPLGLQSHSAVRQRTGSPSSRGPDPPRRGIQRGRQTVPTEFFCCRRLSSRTEQTDGSFPTGQACR